jgi:hypothetical protein
LDFSFAMACICCRLCLQLDEGLSLSFRKEITHVQGGNGQGEKERDVPVG